SATPHVACGGLVSATLSQGPAATAAIAGARQRTVRKTARMNRCIFRLQGRVGGATPVRVFRSFAKQPIFPKKRDLPAIIRQFLAYPHSNKSLYVSRNSKNHNSLAPLQGWLN